MDKKFNNIGKRDILIFPKFQNLYLIQEIRKKYDRLANLVEPHITLGICDNIDFLQNFDYKFETIVNEISIEQIGENEESIILKNIKL